MNLSPLNVGTFWRVAEEQIFLKYRYQIRDRQRVTDLKQRNKRLRKLSIEKMRLFQLSRRLLGQHFKVTKHVRCVKSQGFYTVRDILATSAYISLEI